MAKDGLKTIKSNCDVNLATGVIIYDRTFKSEISRECNKITCMYDCANKNFVISLQAEWLENVWMTAKQAIFEKCNHF